MDMQAVLHEQGLSQGMSHDIRLMNAIIKGTSMPLALLPWVVVWASFVLPVLFGDEYTLPIPVGVAVDGLFAAAFITTIHFMSRLAKRAIEKQSGGK